MERRPYERLTAQHRRAFLAALAEGWTVAYAAELAGVPRRQTLYELRARDRAFARAWTRALRVGDAALDAARDAELDALEKRTAAHNPHT